MSKRKEIELKLEQAFSPSHLEVVDESFMHRGPADAESHFKIVIATEQFSALSLIKRHRKVNAIVKMEENQIHALALHTYTSVEWQTHVNTESPKCKGNS